MSQRSLVLFAALGSAALLAGAFIFQQLGYAPCKMCIWQRYPHAVASALGVAFLLIPGRILAWGGAGAAAATGGIGAFHSGVEQKWWEGPASCSGGGAGLGGLSGSDLLSTDTVARVVMCDEISWAFAGLSMPTWNALLSFALALLWVRAATLKA
ncbi:MAG: disulfide bond formation protein B [Pseudomonadota bacterium]